MSIPEKPGYLDGYPDIPQEASPSASGEPKAKRRAKQAKPKDGDGGLEKGVLLFKPSIIIDENTDRILRQTASGEVFQSSNFLAWYVTIDQHIKLDGSTKTFCQIGGRRAGRSLPIIKIEGKDFPQMGWLHMNGGAWTMCVIEASGVNAGTVRNAIPRYSEYRGFEERLIYTYVGWTTLPNGEHVYLHNAGGMGSNGNRSDILCEPPSQLSLVRLPDPASGDELRHHLLKFRAFLDVAEPRVMAPIMAAIPAAVLSVFQSLHSSIGIHGPTGSGKTSVLQVGQAAFGQEWVDAPPPVSGMGTTNANIAIIAHARNMMVGADDYVVEGSNAHAAKQSDGANSQHRAFGNGTTKDRMTSSGDLRESPRIDQAVVAVTAEQGVEAHSAVSRTLSIDVDRRTFNFAALTACQSDAREGLYASVLSAFVQYTARHWEETKEKYLREIAQQQNVFRKIPTAHPRIPNVVATLQAAMAMFLRTFVNLGSISEAERQDWLEVVNAGLREVATRQTQILQESDPVDLFRDLVNAAVSSERAHLLDRSTGGEPAFSTRFGWRYAPRRAGYSIDGVMEPRGNPIGWVDIDTDSLYLDPLPALAAAMDMAQRTGRHIHLTKNGLGTRLRDRNLLQSKDPQHNRSRLMVKGARSWVYHLALSTFFGIDQIEDDNQAPLRNEVA